MRQRRTGAAARSGGPSSTGCRRCAVHPLPGSASRSRGAAVRCGSAGGSKSAPSRSILVAQVVAGAEAAAFAGDDRHPHVVIGGELIEHFAEIRIGGCSALSRSGRFRVTVITWSVLSTLQNSSMAAFPRLIAGTPSFTRNEQMCPRRVSAGTDLKRRLPASPSPAASPRLRLCQAESSPCLHERRTCASGAGPRTRCRSPSRLSAPCCA